MLILRHPEWKERIEAMLTQFDHGLTAFISEDDRQRGGFDSVGRDAKGLFHALPALAIGVVNVAIEQYQSHNHLLEAMLAANREAKKSSGSALFVERRSPTDTSRASLGPVPPLIIPTPSDGLGRSSTLSASKQESHAHHAPLSEGAPRAPDAPMS